MKQYRFIEPNQTPLWDNVGLELIIDGINLDRTIDGYQTLSVQGRELIGRDIESRNYKTIRAGKKTQTSRNYRASLAPNVLISSTVTSRPLIVQYELKAKTDGKFRRAWEKMNLFVSKEEVSATFTDDPKYYYVGTLSQAEDVDADSNHIFGVFQIECMDPYKYRTLAQEWNFDTDANFPQYSDYPVIIEEVRIKPKVSTSAMRISNHDTGAFLQIDHTINAGQELIIDLTEATARLSTGLDLMPYHNVFSDFEDFAIYFGERIFTNVSADVTVTYRRRML